ncbi:MAG: hypothetical protein KBB83_02060, partial [Alphaproteobacteria bacterium]|nr:hypothetical protein [Alphaproteobacteria bacterium]
MFKKFVSYLTLFCFFNNACLVPALASAENQESPKTRVRVDLRFLPIKKDEDGRLVINGQQLLAGRDSFSKHNEEYRFLFEGKQVGLLQNFEGHLSLISDSPQHFFVGDLPALKSLSAKLSGPLTVGNHVECNDYVRLLVEGTTKLLKGFKIHEKRGKEDVLKGKAIFKVQSLELDGQSTADIIGLVDVQQFLLKQGASLAADLVANGNSDKDSNKVLAKSFDVAGDLVAQQSALEMEEFSCTGSMKLSGGHLKSKIFKGHASSMLLKKFSLVAESFENSGQMDLEDTTLHIAQAKNTGTITSTSLLGIMGSGDKASLCNWHNLPGGIVRADKNFIGQFSNYLDEGITEVKGTAQLTGQTGTILNQFSAEEANLSFAIKLLAQGDVKLGKSSVTTPLLDNRGKFAAKSMVLTGDLANYKEMEIAEATLLSKKVVNSGTLNITLNASVQGPTEKESKCEWHNMKGATLIVEQYLQGRFSRYNDSGNTTVNGVISATADTGQFGGELRGRYMTFSFSSYAELLKTAKIFVHTHFSLITGNPLSANEGALLAIFSQITQGSVTTWPAMARTAKLNSLIQGKASGIYISSKGSIHKHSNITSANSKVNIVSAAEYEAKGGITSSGAFAGNHTAIAASTIRIFDYMQDIEQRLQANNLLLNGSRQVEDILYVDVKENLVQGEEDKTIAGAIEGRAGSAILAGTIQLDNRLALGVEGHFETNDSFKLRGGETFVQSGSAKVGGQFRDTDLRLNAEQELRLAKGLDAEVNSSHLKANTIHHEKDTELKVASTNTEDATKSITLENGALVKAQDNTFVAGNWIWNSGSIKSAFRYLADTQEHYTVNGGKISADQLIIFADRLNYVGSFVQGISVLSGNYTEINTSLNINALGLIRGSEALKVNGLFANLNLGVMQSNLYTSNSMLYSQYKGLTIRDFSTTGDVLSSMLDPSYLVPKALTGATYVCAAATLPYVKGAMLLWSAFGLAKTIHRIATADRKSDAANRWRLSRVANSMGDLISIGLQAKMVCQEAMRFDQQFKISEQATKYYQDAKKTYEQHGFLGLINAITNDTENGTDNTGNQNKDNQVQSQQPNPAKSQAEEKPKPEDQALALKEFVGKMWDLPGELSAELYELAKENAGMLYGLAKDNAMNSFGGRAEINSLFHWDNGANATGHMNITSGYYAGDAVNAVLTRDAFCYTGYDHNDTWAHRDTTFAKSDFSVGGAKHIRTNYEVKAGGNVLVESDTKISAEQSSVKADGAMQIKLGAQADADTVEFESKGKMEGALKVAESKNVRMESTNDSLTLQEGTDIKSAGSILIKGADKVHVQQGVQAHGQHVRAVGTNGALVDGVLKASNQKTVESPNDEADMPSVVVEAPNGLAKVGETGQLDALLKDVKGMEAEVAGTASGPAENLLIIDGQKSAKLTGTNNASTLLMMSEESDPEISEKAVNNATETLLVGRRTESKTESTSLIDAGAESPQPLSQNPQLEPEIIPESAEQNASAEKTRSADSHSPPQKPQAEPEVKPESKSAEKNTPADNTGSADSQSPPQKPQAALNIKQESAVAGMSIRLNDLTGSVGNIKPSMLIRAKKLDLENKGGKKEKDKKVKNKKPDAPIQNTVADESNVDVSPKVVTEPEKPADPQPESTATSQGDAGSQELDQLSEEMAKLLQNIFPNAEDFIYKDGCLSVINPHFADYTDFLQFYVKQGIYANLPFKSVTVQDEEKYTFHVPEGYEPPTKLEMAKMVLDRRDQRIAQDRKDRKLLESRKTDHHSQEYKDANARHARFKQDMRGFLFNLVDIKRSRILPENPTLLCGYDNFMLMSPQVKVAKNLNVMTPGVFRFYSMDEPFILGSGSALGAQILNYVYSPKGIEWRHKKIVTEDNHGVPTYVRYLNGTFLGGIGLWHDFENPITHELSRRPVGLYLDTLGRAEGTGGVFVSHGDIWIHALRGFCNEADMELYMYDHYKEDGAFTTKEKSYFKTKFLTGAIMTPGKLVIINKEGGCKIVGGIIRVGDGAFIVTRKTPKFLDIVGEEGKISKKETLKFIKSKKKKWDEVQETTAIFNTGSSLFFIGAVDAEGVKSSDIIFRGFYEGGNDGTLHLKGKKVYLTNRVLNHLSSSKGSKVTTDVSLDPLKRITKTLKTISTLVDDCDFDKLKSGLTDILGPSVKVRLSWGSSKTKSQSIGHSGIRESYVIIDADEVDQTNGFQLKVEKDFTLLVDNYFIDGVMLVTEHESESFGLWGSLSGGGSSFGVDYQHAKSHLEQLAKSSIHVGGKTKGHANKIVKNGSDINLGDTSDFTVDKTIEKEMTPQNSSSSTGISAGTHGGNAHHGQENNGKGFNGGIGISEDGDPSFMGGVKIDDFSANATLGENSLTAGVEKGGFKANISADDKGNKTVNAGVEKDGFKADISADDKGNKTVNAGVEKDGFKADISADDKGNKTVNAGVEKDGFKADISADDKGNKTVNAGVEKDGFKADI